MSPKWGYFGPGDIVFRYATVPETAEPMMTANSLRRLTKTDSSARNCRFWILQTLACYIVLHFNGCKPKTERYQFRVWFWSPLHGTSQNVAMYCTSRVMARCFAEGIGQVHLSTAASLFSQRSAFPNDWEFSCTRHMRNANPGCLPFLVCSRVRTWTFVCADFDSFAGLIERPAARSDVCQFLWHMQSMEAVSLS